MKRTAESLGYWDSPPPPLQSRTASSAAAIEVIAEQAQLDLDDSA